MYKSQTCSFFIWTVCCRFKKWRNHTNPLKCGTAVRLLMVCVCVCVSVCARTVNGVKQHGSLHRRRPNVDSVEICAVGRVCVCVCVCPVSWWMDGAGVKAGSPCLFCCVLVEMGRGGASELHSLLIRSVCHTSSPYLKVWWDVCATSPPTPSIFLSFSCTPLRFTHTHTHTLR